MDELISKMMIEADKDEKIEIPTAGLNEGEKFMFDPGPYRCGKIKDGVSFGFSNELGSWVVDFKMLKVMVDLAEKVRNKTGINEMPDCESWGHGEIGSRDLCKVEFRVQFPMVPPISR